MLSSLQDFFHFVKTDATLLAAGKNYTTQLSAAWELPQDPTYPIVAMTADTTGPPLVIRSTRDVVLVKLWYLTQSSMLDAIAFRDALKARIEQQQSQLASEGVLHVNLVTIETTALGRDSQTLSFMAYAEILLVE